MKRTYYLAYGMNTNVNQMAVRCPNARLLGKVELKGYRLVFRHFCDIEQEHNKTMECALWSITRDCEQSLDRLEGFPVYYRKKEMQVMHDGKKIRAMVYYMTERESLEPPSQSYLDIVTEGYRQNNMDTDQLAYALKDIIESNYV